MQLEQATNLLAGRVPGPVIKDFGDFRAFRHTENTIHQAIVQKLVRMVSTLDGSLLLLNHGYLQEQACMQRVLGEIQEDISFLVFGVLEEDSDSPLHGKYFDAFFEEEFDADTAIESTQKRPMVPRQKIQAYLSRTEFSPLDPSTGIELLRTMHKTYSGYVHAASPHIMDMYGGDPARFHMRGMMRSNVYDAHRDDLRNYFYRGISACALSAKHLGRKLFSRNAMTC